MDQGPQSVTLRTRGRVADRPGIRRHRRQGQPGHPVRIADVADVEDGMADLDTIATLNGTRHGPAERAAAVGHQHRRRSANDAKERIEEIKKALPAGYELRIVRDGAEFIEASIHNVEEHLIVGSILAALVVLLFLTTCARRSSRRSRSRRRSSRTFGLIWFMGFTLDTLTMLALTLSVGIVIDDAIVVLENIYRFIEEKHEDQFQAAIDGTKEIGLAVLATTLSLAAIFVPVAFMGGIVGRFMKSFGLTMAFAIMVSLVVSFTLTPMLSARFLKIQHKGKGGGSSKDSRVFRAVDVFYTQDARMGDEPPGDCGRPRRAGAGLERAALHGRQQELPAERRSVRVRDHSSRARGDEPRVDRSDHEPDYERDPEPDAGSGVHAGADCRRWSEDTQPGQHLRPADADRRSPARSVRGHGRRPQPDSSTALDRPADRGAACGQHRRRRESERRHPVHHQRARSGEARHLQQAAGRARPQDEGRGGRRHVAQRGQAGNVGADRSAEGGRHGRADRGRRRSDAPAGGRRPGDDLQRRRRAVRSPSAREARRSEHPGGDRRADRAFVQAGHCVARQRRHVLARLGSVRHQPAAPSAPGHGVRQPAAGRVQAEVQNAMEAEFRDLKAGRSTAAD